MDRATFTAHSVHLYEHGRYVRTLAHAFNAEAASAFVASYNRMAAADGRSAVMTVHEVLADPPPMLAIGSPA